MADRPNNRPGLADDEATLLAFENEKARSRNEAEKKKQEHQEKLNQLKADYDERLKKQQELFRNVRRPEEERKVGGIVGKFLHLAELQAESLAGIAIMEYMMFIVSLLVCKTHRENLALYKMAEQEGFAYDPDKHTIFKVTKDGKLDFNSPYGASEKIPTEAIYANGYFPKPDITRSFQLEFYRFLEVQGGAEMLPRDVLTELYGEKKADSILQKSSLNNPEDTQSQRIAAGLTRPKPQPK